MDGFSLAREIRGKDEKIPIIFITAKSQKSDKLKGYDLGADDYIIKPFDEDELLWKIKAIIRKLSDLNAISGTGIISLGKYKFDCKNQSLSINSITLASEYSKLKIK